MLDNENKKPLADRMRPEKLSDFVGQEGIIGEGKILRKIIESDQIPSQCGFQRSQRNQKNYRRSEK